MENIGDRGVTVFVRNRMGERAADEPHGADCAFGSNPPDGL
jgi:hypothetical protein